MKKIINTPHAPAPIGPYSHAVKAGSLIYISGQIALDPSNNSLITSSLADETRQVMSNLDAVLKEAGCSFEQVVKTTIFLSDMEHFPVVNEVYGSYFSSNFPARETVAVAGLPKNVNVEISMIAVAES